MSAFEGVIDQKWGIRHCSRSHIAQARKQRKVIIDRIREILRLRTDAAFSFGIESYSDATRSSTYMRAFNRDQVFEL